MGNTNLNNLIKSDFYLTIDQTRDLDRALKFEAAEPGDQIIYQLRTGYYILKCIEINLYKIIKMEAF